MVSTLSMLIFLFLREARTRSASVLVSNLPFVGVNSIPLYLVVIVQYGFGTKFFISLSLAAIMARVGVWTLPML